MNVTYNAQLYLGPEEKQNFPQDQIIRKIESTAESLNLKRLLIWDTHPGNLTEEIISFCHSRSIEAWLWHPVLADMNSFAVTPDRMAEVPFFKGLDKLSGVVVSWNILHIPDRYFALLNRLNI
ncbi:MAG: hypothetical protein JXR86_16385 [Spirochaetales bacterium]|nr:hypothetical protein [Spirochaetales bacterium]